MTRREAILDAATRLFSEKGFKDTSIAELATTTGVAEGTIFYHFKSKEDLLLQILEGIKVDILREFDRYIEARPAKRGLDQVQDALLFYLYLAGQMDSQFLLLQSHYLYRLADTNGECRTHLEAIFNCLVDIFEQAVLLGWSDGSIADVPARKAALLLFTMVDGLVRFKNYGLYDASALVAELIASSVRMLQQQEKEGRSRS